ncbi:MAG: S41 family peptidase [Acidobacteriota bacterium]|nr:S41 family peptidase [Acidobacteriota bacterium]
MKKYIALVACLLVLTFAVNFVSAQTESTPQIRQKTFEKIWKTVNEKFYDANFGGIDWKAAKMRYAPQVAQVKSDAEFYELMERMLGEFKVSHLEIITPDIITRLREPGATTGLGLREIENQVVIARLLDDSSAAKAGLRMGYVVTKINGEAVKNLDDAKRKLSGKPNTTLKLSYLNEADEERETILERTPLSESDRGNLGGGLYLYALFDSRRLDGNIGYVHFTNFLPFLSPRITAAIESFKDASGIIIDLRGNGGGDDGVALKMANMLFDKKTQLMITKTRKGDDFYYKAKPVKNPFLGRLAILIDEHSGSASEQIAAGLQESKRAVVIGKRSEGADLDADSVELPLGALLLYPYGQPRTPRGIVIEGRGVIPDREVYLTRKDLLIGRDAQLEAAIEYIKSNN